jgi:ParB family transcriptional regulator, chromosome partitioning protein
MPPKKLSTVDRSRAVKAAGKDIPGQEQQSEVGSTQPRVATLPLHEIIDRVTDTREIKPQHVEDLMQSIAVLGLLEPLVVDSRGRLLAGGHRKSAISLLREQQPTEYAQHFPDELVPVRILGFDADVDADLALQVEIAENELRRDYTSAEVRVLAERLKASGYVDLKGRPALGEKALRPALKVIIGKSLRTVQRYLNETEEKSMTNVVLFSSEKAVGDLQASLSKWKKAYGGSEDETVKAIEQSVTLLLDQLTEINASTDKS